MVKLYKGWHGSAGIPSQCADTAVRLIAWPGFALHDRAQSQMPVAWNPSPLRSKQRLHAPGMQPSNFRGVCLIKNLARLLDLFLRPVSLRQRTLCSSFWTLYFITARLDGSTLKNYSLKIGHAYSVAWASAVSEMRGKTCRNFRSWKSISFYKEMRYDWKGFAWCCCVIETKDFVDIYSCHDFVLLTYGKLKKTIAGKKCRPPVSGIKISNRSFS